ncbi:MAG: hypothetical protein IJ457_03100 [Clostridia bacterium]|nr:hypothetical protein [Clostridia bacterium]
MKISIKSKDIIWSYLGSIFQYCTSLLILPMILGELTKSELGIWYSFASVSTLATYLDFGFSTTMVRNITYAWSGAKKIRAEGFDDEAVNDEVDLAFIKKVLFACRIVCLAIALAALVILFFGGSAYIRYISRDVDNTRSIMIAWFIYMTGVFFNIYYNYCGHTLRGIGKISSYQKIVVFSRIAQIVVSFVGIRLGFGLIGLSAAYLIAGFLIRFSSKIFIDRAIDAEAKRQNFNFESRDTFGKRLSEVWDIFKTVWHNAKKSGIVSLCSYGINQSLTLICAAYLGVEETAGYGLCHQIITAIMSVAGIMFAAHQPKMINCLVLKENDRYRRTFSMCMVVFGIISIGGILCFAALSKPLLALIGSKTEIPLGMFLFMGLYMFLEHNHGEYTANFTMRNSIEYLPSYIVSSVLIVALSWMMAVLGANIYILMTVHFAVQICFNNWYWPYKAMKMMKTNIKCTVVEGSSELKSLVFKMIRKK